MQGEKAFSYLLENLSKWGMPRLEAIQAIKNRYSLDQLAELENSLNLDNALDDIWEGWQAEVDTLHDFY